MYNLKNNTRIVVITGGTKGVGKGIAECFLQQGDTVIICARKTPLEPIRGHGAQIDNCAHYLEANLKEVAACEALIEKVVQQWGRVDVLINNAGGAPYALAQEASPRFHESIVRLNLLSPLWLALRANHYMQQQDTGGVVVFIGSVSALRPSPGTSSYGAAKAGILNLVKSLAIEWAPKVRVVAVSPGMVQTEQSHLHFGDAKGLAAVAQTVPLQRLATPSDIGQACVFVASDGASYISGTNLTVHGGGEKPSFLAAATANQPN